MIDCSVVCVVSKAPPLHPRPRLYYSVFPAPSVRKSLQRLERICAESSSALLVHVYAALHHVLQRLSPRSPLCFVRFGSLLVWSGARRCFGAVWPAVRQCFGSVLQAGLALGHPEHGTRAEKQGHGAQREGSMPLILRQSHLIPAHRARLTPSASRRRSCWRPWIFPARAAAGRVREPVRGGETRSAVRAQNQRRGGARVQEEDSV